METRMVPALSVTFQSTPPVWGRPAAPSFRPLPQIYFNLRPPCGGRHDIHTTIALLLRFQSTPPWGATSGAQSSSAAQQISIHATIHYRSSGGYFNPRPHVGATPAQGRSGLGLAISIHAPHAGGDTLNITNRVQNRDFNPRPPCGGRLLHALAVQGIETFQSTPPMRGATCSPSIP